MYIKHFTLVELLVVIAIISILAALLLPTLSKAQDAAFEATCISNKKQFMAAQLLYSTEYTYMVVSTPYRSSSGGWGYYNFIQLFRRGVQAYNLDYLPDSVMICTKNSYALSSITNLTNNYDAWIGMPHFDSNEEKNYLTNNTNKVDIGSCINGNPADPIIAQVNPALCTNPAKLLMVADSTHAATTNKVAGLGGNWAFWAYPASNAKRIHLAHDGRTTAGFVDGHATALDTHNLFNDTPNKPKQAIAPDGMTLLTL